MKVDSSTQNVEVHAAGNQESASTDVAGAKEKPQKQALFHDDTLPSFFRRLAWSPDGDPCHPTPTHEVPLCS